MLYRKLGTTDINISAIGLGTWAIGGGAWWGETDDEESIRTIHAALDAGINLIDTAPGYGFGRSEEVIGRAIAGRRDSVVLATKCGLWWEDAQGGFFFEIDGKRIHRSLRPETIRREVEMSLQRLGTDHIDLLQTHWQVMASDPTPIADTMACLLALKAEGKIRAIGVSNVNIPQLSEYLAAGTIESNQPKYSMLDREIEAEMLPFCREHHVSVLVYSPLEQGLLTGKIGMERVFNEGEYRNNIPWFRPAPRKHVLEMLAGWADLTAKYQCTLGQLVIAWTILQPGITVALCGARHPEQTRENALASNVQLTQDDIKRMRRDVVKLDALK